MNLPNELNTREIEDRWMAFWASQNSYRYLENVPREATFVIDTPPPTVSGALHVGHVFSYTQTDIIARYKRMCGFNIFYPMGWDDNGLPTERRVQNYFNVRVALDVPNVENFESLLTPTPAAPSRISRPDFIRLCHRMTQQDEAAFTSLFKRLSLSVDWEQTYATIDDTCRKLAQWSFLQLHQSQQLYWARSPVMWDVDFQTAVAQAEVEDRPVSGHYYNIAFGAEGGPIIVATTRPELLAACVGITAHPNDPRYRHLFGTSAVTPVFYAPVPIFPSEEVEPDKGTGIVMVCTFGDATDILWWRRHTLPLRQLVGRDGRLQPVIFGSPEWPSLAPDKANTAYALLAQKSTSAARTAMGTLLRDPALASAPDRGAPLQGEPTPTTRSVKFFEKGDRPLEYLITRQCFVRLMDKKELFLRAGEQVQWHPDFMQTRYRHWVEGLSQDWCISRQRYFGVQFPVWYGLDGSGRPDYEHPLLAKPDQLPVDPTVDCPSGYSPEQRGQPCGFVADADVFDTWFTSALTPLIPSRWVFDPARKARLFPSDIRPQSHEIIRTWAFYTLVMGLLHEGTIPWKHLLVSGWILDPDRKKMSKSKGNVVTPTHLLDTYSADAVRYWAATARLGVDTAYDEKVFKIGKRLVIKLFNAAKWVLSSPSAPGAVTSELDRAFIWKLGILVEEATLALEHYAYAAALEKIESFFWFFTDSYLELTKTRVRGGETKEEQESAMGALALGFDILVRLFAPFLPYITEEIWSWISEAKGRKGSVHRASWPMGKELASVPPPQNKESLEIASAALRAIHKSKTEAKVSLGKAVKRLVLEGAAHDLALLNPVVKDVLAAGRCATWEPIPTTTAIHGTLFSVRVLELEAESDVPREGEG